MSPAHRPHFLPIVQAKGHKLPHAVRMPPLTSQEPLEKVQGLLTRIGTRPKVSLAYQQRQNTRASCLLFGSRPVAAREYRLLS